MTDGAMSSLTCDDFVLDDGGGVHIRPLRPADRAMYDEAVAGLSPRSRYLRFAAPMPRMSERLLEQMMQSDATATTQTAATTPAKTARQAKTTTPTTTTPTKTPTTTPRPAPVPLPPAPQQPSGQQAAAVCKKAVQVQPTLSASAKTRLERTCEKASGGGQATLRQIAHELCVEVIKSSHLPAGRAREQARAVCKNE